MSHSNLSTADRKAIHTKEAKRITEYLINHGFDVKYSIEDGYEYIVNGMKCIVAAHQNIPASKTKAGKEAILIEIANDKHTILDTGYDTILYIDTTNRKRDKFYMINVRDIYPAIQAGLSKKPTILPNGKIYTHFFRHRNNDVTSNSGYCVGITELVFAKLPGVTLFDIQ